MAMQPSTSEDEQVNEAAADVGKGPKPVLVSDENPEEAGERTVPRSTFDWRKVEVPEGMPPFRLNLKTTEDSLRRNVKLAEPHVSLRKILRRIKRMLGAGEDPILVSDENPEEAGERTVPRSTFDWRKVEVPEGMPPFRLNLKTTEDSLKRNIKPPEKRDKKPIAERFSSWLRQRRGQRAGASG